MVEDGVIEIRASPTEHRSHCSGVLPETCGSCLPAQAVLSFLCISAFIHLRTSLSLLPFVSVKMRSMGATSSTNHVFRDLSSDTS